MLKQIRAFFFSTPVVIIRATALFTCVVWMIVPTITNIVAYGQNRRVERSAEDDAATRQYLQNIQNEHRFSVLETRITAIDERTSFMQNTMWGLVVGMSGLLGERGISLVRKKQKALSGESENEE